MNILWFSPFIEQVTTGFTSKIASVRLRCTEIIPHLASSPLNHNVTIAPIGQKVKLTISDLNSADIAVFGKLFFDCTNIFKTLKERNIPIVVDVCDDIFNNENLVENYRSALHYADFLTCCSEKLKEHCEANCSIPTYFIPDAQEGIKLPPENYTVNDNKLEITWIGQPPNLKSLIPVVDEIESINHNNISLNVVTKNDPSLDSILNSIKVNSGPKLNITITDWSVENQSKAISNANLVIIPSDDRISSKVKSPNRLTSAYWSGTFVVAYPIPSYQDFRDEAILDNSIINGINRYLDLDSQIIKQSILNAQNKIENNFTPEKAASKWNDVLSTVQKQVAKSGALTTDGNVKLNLGCGDKILPGYTNVDLVSERAGKKPEVNCDIRNLSVFTDNYADEILSVHVIEHFYFWEVEMLLHEWIRVLKPGGKMIVECPNLISACEAVLNDPINAAKPGAEGQRSMWVFYGDPSWKDPLMCHKWLYTPQSLSELLSRCGLTNIKQEPAEFKLREPRDMRIVGYKPS